MKGLMQIINLNTETGKKIPYKTSCGRVLVDTIYNLKLSILALSFLCSINMKVSLRLCVLA